MLHLAPKANSIAPIEYDIHPMGYDILRYTYFTYMIFQSNISYIILYLYLICEMNKKMKYILFSIFKIKIISHFNIFNLKNENFVMFNNIHD